MTPKEQYEARKAARREARMDANAKETEMVDLLDRFVTAAERIADALEERHPKGTGSLVSQFPWESNNTFALRRRKQPINEWLFDLLRDTPKDRILIYTMEYDEAHLNVRIDGKYIVGGIATNGREGLTLLKNYGAIHQSNPL